MVGAESVFLFFLLAWLLAWRGSSSCFHGLALLPSFLLVLLLGLFSLSLSLPLPLYPSTSPKWLSSISNGLVLEFFSLSS